ncbi:hypothetical protein SELMODRAFT_230448 [Selaginella moellendorffii]|uniref:Amino acid transporter transmembrane domain-containing protein n=1 Tax=Selaginella moellendorffii TaxID=88036 RepID=D8R1D1_SELML|nr:hypothetical protein SELMODRAFT_230448 [Selaginella moellendorffii]
MASSGHTAVAITDNPATESSPLLPKRRDEEEEEEEEEGFEVGISGASAPSAVFNLLTTIVGAGIMALPATQKELGIFLGMITIVFVGILTDASLEILLRFSKAANSLSYSSLMADAFGITGRTLLQLSIIVNNVGLLIVYMIIIGDVLSGSGQGAAHHSGVLEEWGGGSFWWNGRFFILLLTTVLVLVPLVSFKRVDSLRFSSALSIALAVVFVVVTGVITATKLMYKEIPSPRWLPDVHDQFSFWKLFTAVPVIVTAYICHHNLHPIANELDDPASMQKICRVSITICTFVYIATALFGYLLFGASTMDDVLANFDADLRIPYGKVLAGIVRVGYAVHLMLVFPLIHFSLRINLDSLLFPKSAPISEDNRRFACITTVLILVIFFGSTLVPNIWTVFQFTGATAAVCIGFVFPGIIALRDKHGIATGYDKTIASIMVILAVVSSITAITTNVYGIISPGSKKDKPGVSNGTRTWF